MDYLTFQTYFAAQALVSLPEIRYVFPGFDPRRLVEWQRRGYLRRLVNGWYYFTQVPVTEHLLWWAAGRLYQPAYLSLETAFSHYGLIPEGVYTLTSVSTRKTQAYATTLGNFSYSHLKPALYFGYEVLRPAERPLLLATLEKALLDYCYLHPRLTSPADFQALRLHAEVLHTRLNHERLQAFQQLFGHARLDQRVRTLLHTYDYHA